MSNSLLTIGYSVLAERVKNITVNNFRNNPEIFISVQNPIKLDYTFPDFPNINHVERSTIGVAKSRNEVLFAVTTKYLIFGDDDIIFREDDLSRAVDYLESHPECDMVLGSTLDENGSPRKKYSKKKVNLTHFNSAKAATYEMLIRVDAFRKRNLRFDEGFGAGVENYLGDEYILITDLLKSGGKGVFLPLIFAVHPEESSGSDWGSRKDLKARALVFDRIFGIWAVPIRAAFIVRPSRTKISISNKFRFISNNWW